jgi:hypothetical protein
MNSGPLIPANGRTLHEIPSPYAIDLGRQLEAHAYPPVQESPLRDYLRVLIKRKWVVIACLVVIFLAVAIASLRSTPIYEAAGSIAINRLDPATLNFKDSSNGGMDY